MSRNVGLAVHWGRITAISTATELATGLKQAGLNVFGLTSNLTNEIPNCTMVDESEISDIESLLVVGGDGTILRNAELARALDIPLLGINHGHVGFLAEAEAIDVDRVITAIADQNWHIENRITLDVVVHSAGEEIWRSWALNEVSIEKASNERIVEVVTAVDHRPVSRYAGDGVIVATPTGSTAYAFSAGGPVVWPNVDAVVLVPLSAHALFSRPLVLSPTSTVEIELLSTASAWADSRRGGDFAAGSQVRINKSDRDFKLMRLDESPFSDRLVAKFDLPITGWRGSTKNFD